MGCGEGVRWMKTRRAYGRAIGGTAMCRRISDRSGRCSSAWSILSSRRPREGAERAPRARQPFADSQIDPHEVGLLAMVEDGRIDRRNRCKLRFAGVRHGKSESRRAGPPMPGTRANGRKTIPQHQFRPKRNAPVDKTVLQPGSLTDRWNSCGPTECSRRETEAVDEDARALCDAERLAEPEGGGIG